MKEIHLGEIIRLEILAQRHTNSSIAKQLNMSASTMGDKLSKEFFGSVEDLVRISEILKRNFLIELESKLSKELQRTLPQYNPNRTAEIQGELQNMLEVIQKLSELELRVLQLEAENKELKALKPVFDKLQKLYTNVKAV